MLHVELFPNAMWIWLCIIHLTCILKYYFTCFWKFTLEELANMLTCNLWKTIHDIWLQQFRKRGSYLYTTTSNGNVWSFKQSSLYREYLRGGPSIQGLNRIEFHFHRVSGFSNPLQMVVAIAKYASYFTSRMSHFGFYLNF
jgi:hypothetical protein